MKENYFSKYNRSFLNKVLLTQIVDLEFEAVCLNRYLEVIKSIQRQLESVTTLEQDLALLKDAAESEREDSEDTLNLIKLTPNQRFYVTFRVERKRVIRSQIDMATYLLRVLEESYQVKSLASVGAPAEELDLAFQRIYMQHSDMEAKIDVDEKGNFLDEDREHWYFYRRLGVKDYLRQVFEMQVKQ
mmetsp:Transcript_14219/g.24181  ORF Transcript_14219/g.24181 Transcript_14219/m.24181 type:complete len:187 (+) Transcript_14219:1793-2353(+)